MVGSNSSVLAVELSNFVSFGLVQSWMGTIIDSYFIILSASYFFLFALTVLIPAFFLSVLGEFGFDLIAISFFAILLLKLVLPIESDDPLDDSLSGFY